MSDVEPSVILRDDVPLPSIWRAAHLANLLVSPAHIIPLITAENTSPILPGYDLWDLWPVQLADGATAQFAGGVLWMILSAPVAPDPIYRHAVARIRLLHQRGDAWRDLGPFMPDGLCPGQREWAGSAIYSPDTARITLYYTVAGRRDDRQTTYEQRLFEVSARLAVSVEAFSLTDWHLPHEIIVADGIEYTLVDGSTGVPGFIKGFRDPAFFRDPADGHDYITFTASRAQSAHAFNGLIGMARAPASTGDAWQLMPPLIDADGLNNELERPHIVMHGGLYYVFWSTQRQMFANDAAAGPTGLYGMVATTLRGPYRPLNGSGLVAGNPDTEPHQSYSWWVSNDLSVVSFVDYWGLKGRALADDPTLARAQFGGTPAPLFKLSLDEDCAHICQG